jgi:hypothetical protein
VIQRSFLFPQREINPRLRELLPAKALEMTKPSKLWTKETLPSSKPTYVLISLDFA